MDVKDKVTVVIGGAQGIGLALCTRFARGGARVVLSDLRQEACQRQAAPIGALLPEERFMISTHPWVVEKFAAKAREHDEYIRSLRNARAAAFMTAAAAWGGKANG